MESVVTFAPTWVNSESFEVALRTATVEPHSNQAYVVRFVMPTGCALMVDSGARLLSVANQLSRCTKHVMLDFEEGQSGTMGYLNRMGFFDTLDEQIEVLPERPAISGALLHGGGNKNLVEFGALNPNTVDKELPGRLADSLKNAVSNKVSDGSQLGDTAFTVFSELIQNVYRHSETKLDGYAALQLYRGGRRKVQVEVKKMTRLHVDHGDIARFAQEKVNLPKEKADECRAQARGLREKLDNYLEEHPDFTLKKMMLSGSLAKGTALRSLNDIDIACYISGADAPNDVASLLSDLQLNLGPSIAVRKRRCQEPASLQKVRRARTRCQWLSAETTYTHLRRFASL